MPDSSRRGSALPPRPLGLRSPLALAWRLQRGSLVAWTAGAVLFGLLLGAVSPSISRFVDVPEVQGWVSRMGARDAGDAFLFMVMYVLGQAISAYAIAAALRLRAEETDGHADPVLATAVSRLRWATSHLFFAIIGSAIALALLGLTIGLAYGLSTGDVTHELPRLLGRTMVMLPAIWVLA